MKSKLVIVILTMVMAMSVLCVPAMASDTGSTIQNTTKETSSDISPDSDATEDDVVAEVVGNAPKDINAEVAGYNSIKLTWVAVEGVTGYAIYQADEEAGEYKEIAVVRPDETEYKVKGLTTGKPAYFKILNLKESGNATVAASSQENDVLGQVEAIEATPQLAKTAVKGYAKSRITVNISWEKVAGAQGYIVYKFNEGTERYQKVKTVGKSTTAYTHKKLTAGTKHKYVVRAYRVNDGITAKTNSKVTTVATPKKLTMKTAGFWKTNAGKVIAKAKTKMGRPYVWGASGPSAFDCSGFTCWTMKKVGKKVTGVSLARTSSRGLYGTYNSKYGLGKNLKNAQPGDIIIIGYGGSKSRIFHVGMYYDNGKYIHATTGGRGVTISKIPSSMVVSIIRLPGLE